MNTTTTNPTGKTTTNGTTSATGTAAQACCQGATDAFKAGVETNQKMFNTFTESLTKGMNTNAFTMPVGTMPMAFEKMTKAMNSLVDSGARCMTECNTLMIDAMRNNARMIERTGDVMVGQMTGKSTKPVTETTREIFDEACGFSTKAGERLVKMTAEHAERVTTIVTEATACKSTCNA